MFIVKSVSEIEKLTTGMLFLRLYQVFVLLFPLMISWNSIASSRKLWKRQASNLCPNSKWKENKGMCFLKVDFLSTNVGVYHVCRNKFVGSHLAKIRSMDDLIFIKDSFGFGTNNYWIGLRRDRGRNWIGESVWQDDSNATFLNFAAGQPTNGPNEDCIFINSDLEFYDSTCNQRYWSICSIPASVDLCKTKNVRCHENAQCYNTFLTFVCLCNDGFAGDGISSCTKSDGCPNAEWKEHKGLCYIENFDKANYEDARNNCRSKYNGSSLAKIRFEGDRNFLLNSFKFSGNRWIGLKRTNTWRDELTWDDKSNVTYKTYSVREPNNGGGREECIFTRDLGDWNDIRCDSVQSSFCSINAKKLQTSGGTGAIIAVVVCLLVIGAYIGYKKFMVQRSNAQSAPSKSKDSLFKEQNSNAAGEN